MQHALQAASSPTAAFLLRSRRHKPPAPPLACNRARRKRHALARARIARPALKASSLLFRTSCFSLLCADRRNPSALKLVCKKTPRSKPKGRKRFTANPLARQRQLRLPCFRQYSRNCCCFAYLHLSRLLHLKVQASARGAERPLHFGIRLPVATCSHRSKVTLVKLKNISASS